MFGHFASHQRAGSGTSTRHSDEAESGPSCVIEQHQVLQLQPLPIPLAEEDAGVQTQRLLQPGHHIRISPQGTI